MAKVDCIKLLRKAGIVSDDDAKRLLAKMENLAQERAASRGLSYENAMAEIAGEEIIKRKKGNAVDKRNRLLDLQTRAYGREFVKRWQRYDKALDAFVFGANADVKGAGLGIHQIHQGLRSRYAVRLRAALDEAGALDDFKKGRYGREFYIESEQLGLPNGKPGITGNKSALAMAQAWHGIRKEMVSQLNRRGGFIEEIPGYVLMQTHDRGELVRLNRKDQQDAWLQWWAFTKDKLDMEKTFGGSDPNKQGRKIFENLYAGNHEKNLDVFDVSEFKAHGSLANKVSSHRVLWFKDAAAAFEYNERFGTKRHNDAIFFHIQQMTKNMALMEKLGPNPIENAKRLAKEAHTEAKKHSDSNIKTGGKDEQAFVDEFMRKIDVVSGKLDIPANPSLARWFGLARTARLLATAGKMVLSSFGDKPMMQSHMTWLGMKNLDAWGQAMKLKSRKSSVDMSVALGVVPDSFLGHAGQRWDFDMRNGYASRALANTMFDLNGMNWWTDVNRAVMADGVVSIMAGHSHLPLESLPAETARALRHFDIGAKEWNAIRKTAYAVPEGPLQGRSVITSDAFDGITDDVLDDLLTERGLKHITANRNRQRDLLKQKYEGLLLDAVDTGVPKPGAREKYITTLGGRMQAGTGWGELTKAIMMYKSWPITVAMKVLGREMFGGAENARAWDFLATKQGWFRISQLIAATGIAGYASMTAKDLFAGKEPKPLMVDGEPNMKVWTAALAQGGGLGIYGDFLFTEYDSRYRTFSGQLLGPVVGQLDPIAALATKTRGAVTGAEDIDAEQLGYGAWKLAEQNMPFASLFYVKPVLDYFIFWNVKEMLSPGVMRRWGRSVEDKNHQEFWIDPSGAASIPMNEPDEKLRYFMENISE